MIKFVIFFGEHKGMRKYVYGINNHKVVYWKLREKVILHITYTHITDKILVIVKRKGLDKVDEKG